LMVSGAVALLSARARTAFKPKFAPASSPARVSPVPAPAAAPANPQSTVAQSDWVQSAERTAFLSKTERRVAILSAVGLLVFYCSIKLLVHDIDIEKHTTPPENVTATQ